MRVVRLAVSAVLIGVAMLLLSCESSPKTPAAEEAKKPPAKKEPALYTGKQCFSQMASQAQRWQPDALVFHVESGWNAEANGQGGKATVWRGMFASPSRRTSRTFVCSGSRLPDEAPYGVTSTSETAYPPSVVGLMFQAAYLQADSSQAFDVAQEHGGAALMKKDSEQPVTYLLEWEPRRKELLWYVIYGKTQKDSQGLGGVDAATGKFVRAGK